MFSSRMGIRLPSVIYVTAFLPGWLGPKFSIRQMTLVRGMNVVEENVCVHVCTSLGSVWFSLLFVETLSRCSFGMFGADVAEKLNRKRTGFVCLQNLKRPGAWRLWTPLAAEVRLMTRGRRESLEWLGAALPAIVSLWVWLSHSPTGGDFQSLCGRAYQETGFLASSSAWGTYLTSHSMVISNSATHRRWAGGCVP